MRNSIGYFRNLIPKSNLDLTGSDNNSKGIAVINIEITPSTDAKNVTEISTDGSWLTYNEGLL